MPARQPKTLGAWRDHAACIHVEAASVCERVEKFFPEKSQTTAKRSKRVCWEECAVRVECLDEAIANKERFGIWGGMDTQERREEVQRRQRRGIAVVAETYDDDD